METIEPRVDEYKNFDFGPYQYPLVPKWDVLNREALPDMDGMELNFRPQVDEALEQNRFIRFLLITLPIIFLLNALILRPLAPYLDRDIIIPCIPIGFAFALLLSAALIVGFRQPWWVVFPCLASSLVLVALLPMGQIIYAYHTTSQRSLSLFILAQIMQLGTAFFLGIIADNVADHYVKWALANPNLSRDKANSYRLCWDARFSSSDDKFRIYLPADDPILAAVRSYSIGFLLLFSFLFIYPFASHPNWLMLIFLPPVAALVVNAPYLSSLPWKALVSWATYGRSGTAVPGLWQSPGGPWQIRIALLLAVLFLASFVFLPSSIPPFRVGYFWTGFILLVFGSLLPLLYLLAACFGLLSPVLLAVHDEIEAADAPATQAGKTATELEHYSERLRLSQHPLEREHVMFGVHAVSGYPILLDRSLLKEHVHIVGDTGSGKTSLGLVPLITQLIRRADSAMVIIDLKGDKSLFETARIEAEKAGLTFKYFTNLLGGATYVFNPFQQADTESISLNQICETFLQALRLEHGEGYGRSFYSRVARSWLSDILRRFPNMSSFEELFEKTSPEYFRDPKERQDAFELVSVIRTLASFAQLNLTPPKDDSEGISKNAIFMPEVIKEKQVVYFWLPAAIETASVREIANLAIYALFTSCVQMTRQSQTPFQTYLVIDEFQRIASKGFELVLQQARSMGLSAILANQTLADLKTFDAPELLDIIQSNTRVKQYFAVNDPRYREFLSKLSGETAYVHSYYRDFEEAVASAGSTDRAEVRPDIRLGPRFTGTELAQISSNPFSSIVYFSRDSGFTQYRGLPIPVVSSYFINSEEYHRRNHATWPIGTEHTITPVRPALPAPGEPALQQRKAKILMETSRLALKSSASEAEDKEALPKATSKWADRLNQIYERQQQELQTELGLPSA